MSAFLGISVWITLVTVVPGLITIATVFGALVLAGPQYSEMFLRDLKGLNDWAYAGLAVTVMILTQAIGILLEQVLIGRHWLGPQEITVHIPQGIDPCHRLTRFTLRPYSEYQGLYLLLAELREKQDSQGHLQRAIAQFFLTHNAMVSFGAGILAAVISGLGVRGSGWLVALLYAGLLGVFLFISYKVAIIRFQVMAKALWAARRRMIGPSEPAVPDA